MKNQEQIQAWYIQGNGAMSQEESEQKEKGRWGEQNEDRSAEVQATLGLLEWEGLFTDWWSLASCIGSNLISAWSND